MKGREIIRIVKGSICITTRRYSHEQRPRDLSLISFAPYKIFSGGTASANHCLKISSFSPRGTRQTNTKLVWLFFFSNAVSYSLILCFISQADCVTTFWGKIYAVSRLHHCGQGKKLPFEMSQNYLYNPIALRILVSDWLTKRGIRLGDKHSAYKKLDYFLFHKCYDRQGKLITWLACFRLCFRLCFNFLNLSWNSLTRQ